VLGGDESNGFGAGRGAAEDGRGLARDEPNMFVVGVDGRWKGGLAGGEANIFVVMCDGRQKSDASMS
jgi:hypothetical protein